MLQKLVPYIDSIFWRRFVAPFSGTMCVWDARNKRIKVPLYSV